MKDPFTTQGAVSWTELTTTDPEAAKAFYQAVFGWRFDVHHMGNGVDYNVITVGEDPIGGIMPQPPQAPGTAPAWGSYVTVQDLDTTLAAVDAAGGQRVDGPRPIPDVGRCALIRDPQGALIHAVEYLPKM